jgi:starch phosphorylase
MVSKNSQVTSAQLKAAIEHHLKFTQNELSDTDNRDAYWQATCLAVNDLVVSKLQATRSRQSDENLRSVNYLSLEYLMGRLLSNNLHNLDIYQQAKAAVAELGYDLTDLCEQGADLALGNGGLGRLDACFLDSLATLD